MQAFILAIHALAFWAFLVNPKIGAGLLVLVAAIAAGMARPTLVALFTFAFVWTAAALNDFFPTGPYTAWKDVFLVLLILGWIARCVIQRRPIAIKHPITYPLLILIAFFLALCALSPATVMAVLGLKACVFYMAWYFILPDIVQSKQDARNLLIAILLGTLCLGAYDVWRSIQPMGTFPARSGRFLPGALQLHFSGTAIFLAPGVFLAVAALPSFKGWRKLGVYVTIIVALAGITAALARGVWAGAIFTVVVMTIVSRRKQMIGVLVLAAIAASVLQAIFPVNLNVADRAISAFNEQDTSREAREAEFSTVTLPFVLQHPLGAGTGTMSSAGAMKVWGGGSATDKLLHKGNIHNGFLQVAIETGWMGLAAYLWLLYAMTMSAYQIHRKSRDPFLRDMGLGLFGVMLFYTIMNFSGPMLTTPLISFDIWALAGLIVLLPQFDEPELPAPAPAPALEAVA